MKYLEVRKNLKSLSTLIALGLVAATPMLGIPAWADDDDDDDDDRRSYRVRPNERGNRGQWGHEERIRLHGTVVEDRDYSFVLRTDDGRRVLVQTGNVRANVNRGDRVTVRGFYTGDSFTARRVRVTDDQNWDWNDAPYNDDYYNDNYNRVTVRGVVTRDLWDNDEFEIRAENGRTYRVNLNRNEPRRLSRGDRVEVSGYLRNNILRASSIRVLSDNNNGGWGTSTLSGVVTRDLDGRRFEIRDSSGRTVQVIADNEPRRLSRGDRVYLRGRWDRNVFRASSISLNDNNGNYGYGTRVNFPGIVTSIQSSTRFAVRGDNGRSYSVQTNGEIPRRVDVGDRVRVQGTVIYGGVIRANSNDVDLLNNYNKSDNRENDEKRRNVDISGVVTSTAWLGALVTVRASNGQEHRVRVNLNEGLRRGDRVRIRGYRDGNGVITASSVNRY